MIVRITEIIQGEKYNVNGMQIIANSHFEAIKKWVDIITRSIKNK